MPEKSFSRVACLKDFFGQYNDNDKCNKNYVQNDIHIAKNQQEFGNRKRIKP